jgi:hypothetical protein
MRKIFIAFITFIAFPVSNAFAATLTNPLHTTDVREIIGRLIQAVLGVTGAVALLVFVYGGFMYLISAGEPDRLKKGKNAILYGAYGLAIIMGAYVIVRTIVVAFESGTVT